MASAQLNLRIPVELKELAQSKAENCGTNLNFLVKLFLAKFIEDEKIVEIRQDINIDKIFDKGIATSKKGKIHTRRINKHFYFKRGK